MKDLLKKLMVLLDKKQKRRMILIVLMMIIAALLETASISLVIAVVAVVISPEAIESNKYVSGVYNALGFKSTVTFTIVVMVALVLAFVVKNVYLYVQWKVMYSFVYKNQFSTSERMMRNYLRRGYEYYLFADTAVVQRNITSDVNNMYGLILSLLQVVSESIVFIALVIVLMLQDPVMCIVIAGLLLITLLIIKAVMKPMMEKAGKDNQDYYAGLFKIISQTVMGIKEVKVTGKEQYFVNEYNKCGRGYVNAVQRYSLFTNIPKLLIETICIAGMILYMLALLLMGENLADKLPTFSAFAVAAVKLMPCANKINNQLNNISYFKPFFMGVSDNLQDEIGKDKTDMSFAKVSDKKLEVKKNISLKDITYAYPRTDKLIFDHANMDIPIGAAVGVVGVSGAGKTTVVDILLGLLDLKEGGVYADDVNTKDDYRAWLKNVGYIPQMIFMLDDTIRANVAFGVDDANLSEERIWEVLKEAQLDEFVRSLPEGLDTKIGERGIRLSGGQRQRIGIARALFEDPEVLILDEATSALDGDTESAIMDSINSLHGRKTLVIIAHRLQTIEKCDMIYRVADGKITRER